MPASTFEIIAENWEYEQDVFCKIANTCRIANLCLTVFEGNVEVRVRPSAEKSLGFEIRTQKTLDWYLEKYPMAKDEPAERIPYFIFSDIIGNQKYYSVAMANSYLDAELIWKFTSAYLESYPNHIICLNREIFIDAVKMARIIRSRDYANDWLLNIQ
jgi:hypothetical protein